MNFALIGCGGYIAPKHLRAIKETGNTLVAACDPCDSVGILDSYSPQCHYFKEIERFDRHLDKLRNTEDKVEWVSICTPNYLHDSHIRLALRNGANAICEKPLVINPWNLDYLSNLEKETGKKVFTVLQLRLHPAILALKERLQANPTGKRHQVMLTYCTPRGPWYDVSWKGSEEKSGGIMMNIGIHLFDMLIFLFGAVKANNLTDGYAHEAMGELELERADVYWFLSTDKKDLLPGQSSSRHITVDGEKLDFTQGFTDLHTEVYNQTLAGKGFTVEDSRAAVELVYQLRTRAKG